MKKMLKPGGQIVVLDYKKENCRSALHPNEDGAGRSDRHMESAGFRLHKEHTFLPYQYFLIFTLK